MILKRRFGTKISTMAYDTLTKDYTFYKVPIESLFDNKTKYYLIKDFPGRNALEDAFDINYKLVSKNDHDEKWLLKIPNESNEYGSGYFNNILQVKEKIKVDSIIGITSL